jgi:Ca2+-binding RTX toxin-like protein
MSVPTPFLTPFYPDRNPEHANRVFGSFGTDALYGQGGNDTLYGLELGDLLDGGEGRDEASYVASANAVFISLTAGSATGGDAEGDTLRSIENLAGGAGADTLIGDAGANRLRGGLGADRIEGGAGQDTLSYLDAPDAVFLDLATGAASGSAADGDSFSEIEAVEGSAGADTLRGDGGSNVLRGREGGDLLEGGAGRDHLDYGSSNGGVQVNLATGVALGGDAAGDTILGFEVLRGGNGADSLVGDAGDNALVGGDGSDTLIGGDGDDILTGGARGDRLDGGAGIDRVSYARAPAGVHMDLSSGLGLAGDAANDIATGVEWLVGSSHGDTLRGDAGDNLLLGGGGADILAGGTGLDALRGQAGDDVLRVADPGLRLADGGAGRDTLAPDADGLDFDLTGGLGAKLTSIEAIDLTGHGANTVLLDEAAVLALTEQREAGVAVLRVKGDAGDELRLSETHWTSLGNIVEGGVTYRRILAADGLAEIRITGAMEVGGVTVDLTQLSAQQGFIIQGDAGSDHAGTALRMAGDVNRDGFMDVIIGAEDGDDGGSDAGEAYVLFGGPGSFGTADATQRRVIDLTTLSAAQGFVVRGDRTADNAGGAVGGAGDLNGDGYADMVIAAPLADTNHIDPGQIYVVFGAAGGFGTADGAGRQVIDVGELSAAQGFVIYGAESLENAGTSVAIAGDVNGDGLDDLIIGAEGENRAYVLFGSTHGFGRSDSSNGHARQIVDLETLAPEAGFVLELGDALGRSVAAAGDVNGDGLDDLIIGAPEADEGGTNSGSALVVFGQRGAFGLPVTDHGKTRAVLDLNALTPTLGFVIQGDASGDETGYSVASAGDFNGDGYADLIIGARSSDLAAGSAGAAYVVLGRASGFGTRVDGRTVLDLTNLMSDRGLVLKGAFASDDAGYSVSAAGDVNADGYDDVIIGAPYRDASGSDSGAAYLVFGRAMATTPPGLQRTIIDLNALGAAEGFLITGDAAGDRAGHAVSAAGDVNGDGYDDLLVGAPYGDDGGSSAGEAHLLFGGAFGRALDTTGTSAAEILQGGAGADTLSGGGGADVLRGAAGDDRLEVADTAFRRIEGGTGTDTLVLGGSGRQLDLTRTPGPAIHSVERIDITGSGNNTLVLDHEAVLRLSEQRAGGIATLRVDGNAGDRVFVNDTQWLNAGTITEAGVTYNRLLSTTAGAELRVASAVTLTLPGGVNNPYRFDVSTLTSAQGFAIIGEAAGSDAGWSVSDAGDVNGDGVGDLIIGAPMFSDGTNFNEGRAYVIYGRPGGGFGVQAADGRITIDLAQLDPSRGFVIAGNVARERLGFSVAGAGDVNGDGYDDVIIGAPSAMHDTNGNGGAYVVFGAAGGRGALVTQSGVTRQVLELSGLDSLSGFVIQGDAANDAAGYAVSGAGDINGDGFADIMIGAPDGDDAGDNAGEAYVLFGGAVQVANSVGGRLVFDLGGLGFGQGFVIRGDVAGDRAGVSVSSAGDVNRDGYADMLVGAPLAFDASFYTGQAYLLFGGSHGFGTNDSHGTAAIDLTSLTPSQGTVLRGLLRGDDAGYSVAPAGDVNGDGHNDFLVGAPKAGPGGSDAFFGEAYVVYGTMGGFGTDSFGRREMSLDLMQDQGFTITGDWQTDLAGFSVDAAGDVNGDGYGDLIIGAAYGDDAAERAGQVYVLFGKPGGIGSVSGGRQNLDLVDLASTEGFMIQGVTPFAYTGGSVSAAGDVNRDGFDDLFIGAQSARNEGYVLFGGAFGGAPGPVTRTGGAGTDTLAGTAGDDTLNGGSGGIDVLLGGAGDDLLTATIFLGRANGGRGTDTFAFSGANSTVFATFSNDPRFVGIEGFDLTGTGNNTLVLGGMAVMNLADEPHARFTGSSVTTRLVIDGNVGDKLELQEVDIDGAGPVPLRTWSKTTSNVTLAGDAPGDYDYWSLADGTRTYAVVAVHNDLDMI